MRFVLGAWHWVRVITDTTAEPGTSSGHAVSARISRASDGCANVRFFRYGTLVPRPRFQSLEPARREAILDAASAEFARAGFEAASYNHIIDRAKISKGAMYYYFEDKEDLYITVVRRAMERVVEMFDVVPDANDPETHWLQTQQIYQRTLGLLQADPSAAALALGYVRTRPRLRRANDLDDIYGRARSWLERILRRGQSIGAVRTDLPIGLLVATLYALAETTDEWVASHWDELREVGPDALDQVATKLGDLVRRIAAP